MRSSISLALAGFLAVATLVAFAPVFDNEFVNLDDDVYITANPGIAGGLDGAAISWAFSNDYGSNWHPLTWMSHALDVSLFGIEPVPHHAVNLAFHVANTLLLQLFLTLATGQPWLAALVALLFAIHPQHVESVAWAAERKDVLSTFFGLLALVCWQRFAALRAGAWYFAALAAFAASLMSKAMFVTLPFVLLLFDYWPLRRSSELSLSARIVEKLPFLGVAIAASTLAVLTQGRGGSVGSLEAFPLGLRLANAVVSYATYLVRTLWPLDLAAFYPFPTRGVEPLLFGGSLALLLGVSWLCLWRWRGRPFAPVGWLFYLGTLVPVIGLVQIGRQASADRYTYVPLIGVFVVAVWGALERVAPRVQRIVVPALMLVLCLALVPLTRAQVRTWANTRTLFEHALSLTPSNYFAHYNLGTSYAHADQLEAAAEHLGKARELAPMLPEIAHNFGVVLGRLGRLEEATEEIRAAVALDPDSVEPSLSLGLMLQRRGESAEAQRVYERVLRLDSSNFAAHNNLGALHLGQGRLAEAISHLEAAFALRPGNRAVWQNLKRARARLEAKQERAGGEAETR